MPAKVCLHLLVCTRHHHMEVGTALQMKMGLHQQANDVTTKYVRGDVNHGHY